MEDGRSWIGVEMVLLVVEEEEPVVLEIMVFPGFSGH